MRTQEQVNEIVRLLLAEYPEASCTLDYGKAYELLFSVRLAAQCTDERVNQITPALFARFPTLESFAEADVEEVERYVHSCGFFRAKARDIVACAQMLLEKHGGEVPRTMEELTALPGVGRNRRSRPPCGRSCRRKSPRTSATASCCTAGRSATPESPTARPAASSTCASTFRAELASPEGLLPAKEARSDQCPQGRTGAFLITARCSAALSTYTPSVCPSGSQLPRRGRLYGKEIGT